MILRRLGVRDPGWLVVIVLLIFVIASIEPFQIPGAPPRTANSDWFRWLFQIPAFMTAIMLMAFQPKWVSRIWIGPGRWVAFFAIWQLAVSPFGMKPQVNVLLSLGYAAFAGAGAAVAANGGWPRMRAYLSVTMVFVILASAALLVTGQAGGIQGRTQGIMGHPNHLGGACAIALVLFVYQFRKGENWMIGMIILTGGLLLLTDSRTALVGAVLAVAVSLNDLMPRWVLPTALGIGVTLIVLFTQTDLLAESAGSIARSGDSEELTTLTGRTEIWDLSLEAIAAEPIYGYGPGSSTDLFAEIKPDGVLGSFEINHAHNLWLQLGLIGGIPALVFVLYGLIAYVVASLGDRVWERDAIVLAIVIFGISEPVFSAEPNIFLLIFSACLVSVGDRSQTAGPSMEGEGIDNERRKEQPAVAVGEATP